MNNHDDIWEEFIGVEFSVIYFCSDDHREDEWYTLYCK